MFRPLTAEEDLPSLVQKLYWYHAVNNIHTMNEMLQHLTTVPAAPGKPFYFGIEVDIHVLATNHNSNDHSNPIVVLRHDAAPLSDPSSEFTLESLLASLVEASSTTMSPAVVLSVFKLDCKTPEAWAAVMPLIETVKQRLKLPSMQCLWMNADVVHGPVPVSVSAAAPFVSRTPRGVLLASLLLPCVKLGVTLSLGWTTSPQYSEPYGESHVDEMLSLLQELAQMNNNDSIARFPWLTFPVRYSLVFPAEGGEGGAASAVRAMQKLLTKSSKLSQDEDAVNPFLTFWRGRAMTITDKDVVRCIATFFCTVDCS